MDVAGELARLEEEQHPAGEVAVRVVVEADAVDEAVDVEWDAEDLLRARLLVIRPEVLLRKRHGAHNVAVVVGELPPDEHRPVVIAAVGQLVPGPGAEDNNGHVGAEAAAGHRLRLLPQLPRSVLGCAVEMVEPGAARFLEAL